MVAQRLNAAPAKETLLHILFSFGLLRRPQSRRSSHAAPNDVYWRKKVCFGTSFAAILASMHNFVSAPQKSPLRQVL